MGELAVRPIPHCQRIECFVCPRQARAEIFSLAGFIQGKEVFQTVRVQHAQERAQLGKLVEQFGMRLQAQCNVRIGMQIKKVGRSRSVSFERELRATTNEGGRARTRWNTDAYQSGRPKPHSPSSPIETKPGHSEKRTRIYARLLPGMHEGSTPRSPSLWH